MSTFSRHGNPECIVTDNGPQFTSAEFAEFMHSHGIHYIRTSVYSPAANGAVERLKRYTDSKHGVDYLLTIYVAQVILPIHVMAIYVRYVILLYLVQVHLFKLGITVISVN